MSIRTASYDLYLVHVYAHAATSREGCWYCCPPPVVDYGPAPDAPFRVIEHVQLDRPLGRSR